MNFGIKVLGLCAVLTLAACGGGDGGGSSNDGETTQTPPTFDGEYFSELKPYIVTEQSDGLMRCFFEGLENSICSLDDAMPLGAVIDADTPLEVEDIEKRLLVSHEWMGDAYVEILKRWRWLDGRDILELFRPYTTIVISYEVQGFDYYPDSSTLVIPGKSLWRTKAEYDDVFIQFWDGTEYPVVLQFDSRRRYLNIDDKQNPFANNVYDESNNFVRYTTETKVYNLRALAHSTVHALDYYPYESLEIMSLGGVLNDSLYRQNKSLTQQLNVESPYVSTELLDDYVKWGFQDQAASALLRDATGQEYYSDIVDSKVSSSWGYYHDYEDAAVLFEQFVMFKYLDVIQEWFVTDDDESKVYCNEYEVIDGHRGYTESQKQRMAYVASLIFNQDESAIKAELDAYELKAIPAGLNYCQVRDFEDSIQTQSFDMQRVPLSKEEFLGHNIIKGVSSPNR